jgi:phage-related protein
VEYKAIDDFFRDRGGAEAFLWTPPDETDPKKFVCKKWGKAFPRSTTRSMTATFEQVFDP